ncbi:MAG: phosphatidylserine decarboxylase family protein [Bacteroidetes bacterium]|nr:phosphatidylserine decarboxylase family protein [Bacteroidota bacterium]
MFHKEGYRIIAVTFIVVAAIFLSAHYFINTAWLTYSLWGIGFVFLALILQFFRNPKRNFIPNDKRVLSPVDGKVVVIEEVFEPEYFKDKRLMISVFMSPINVHVTRYPVGGKILYSKYHPGKYLVAWHPKASLENERTTVVVESSEFGPVLFRQIAGALAKRIVNYAQEGDLAAQTTDSGFIKFGSRVDVYLPVNIPVTVALNQVVKGGLSVLAGEE